MKLTEYSLPFRHWVIDEFLSESELFDINTVWPKNGWTKEDGINQVKWSRPLLPRLVARVATRITAPFIERITGLDGLVKDPNFGGGGLHCIPRGGFLRMHVDFNTHPENKTWSRRVNFLLYLNESWREAWGGHLRLGLKPNQRKILPLGGRAVIFETNSNSWHGHPDKLNCPEWVQRRSLAMYFYSKTPPEEPPRTTKYQAKDKRRK